MLDTNCQVCTIYSLGCIEECRRKPCYKLSCGDVGIPARGLADRGKDRCYTQVGTYSIIQNDGKKVSLPLPTKIIGVKQVWAATRLERESKSEGKNILRFRILQVRLGSRHSIYPPFIATPQQRDSPSTKSAVLPSDKISTRRT